MPSAKCQVFIALIR